MMVGGGGSSNDWECLSNILATRKDGIMASLGDFQPDFEKYINAYSTVFLSTSPLDLHWHFLVNVN